MNYWQCTTQCLYSINESEKSFNYRIQKWTIPAEKKTLRKKKGGGTLTNTNKQKGKIFKFKMRSILRTQTVCKSLKISGESNKTMKSLICVVLTCIYMMRH